ncbi:unnamed protein product [Kuraishia capsulata CBS 1993]|uniref:thioredoxin-dependent peroxiredoxin n=1 Tax=Kuraishia capsulata CBS 1993 TaxID=1382522 RepID=W6MUU0_9ASCO|nr:uncharacterized protein KUCA_T00005529001 [Kuraishia capsulata CBS 1993]CDK29537.1 unnamed protein product [Kuraishia capsulata CBS 1993]
MPPRTRSSGKPVVTPKDVKPVKAVKPKSATKPAPKVKKDASELSIGDPIPDLVLLDQNGKEVNLVDLAALKPLLVIFAYPRASTPGCTRQACGFRDNYAGLQSSATVVGISKDLPKSQLNFKVKQKLTYDLLSDPKASLIAQLGADKPGSTIRSHWIFKDGKLIRSHVQISPEKSVSLAKQEVEELA